jgi:hypothetical protein
MSLLVRARVWHQLQICHLPNVQAGWDRTDASPPKGDQSLRGHASSAEDFPRHCPSQAVLGLRRYERGLLMESPP